MEKRKRKKLILFWWSKWVGRWLGYESNLAGVLTKNGRGEDAVVANRPCFVCWKGGYVWKKNGKGSGRKGSGTGSE